MERLGTQWRKSSYSGSNGGNCVEVTQWRKSSFSGTTGGACVEVAQNLHSVVAVRDSKDPDGPRLAFTPSEWQEFATRVKAGQLDLI